MPDPPGVTVEVPATSANLGPGFDSLALCLGLVDSVTAHLLPTGVAAPDAVQVRVTGIGSDGSLPLDATHAVAAALHATWRELGVNPRPVRLRCHNAIPHGRGLGSSAAAIVAGVLVGMRLSGRELDDATRREALRIAARLEGHADNVAACLYGGVVVTWLGPAGVEAATVPVDDTIDPVVVLAPTALATTTARSVLPRQVPLADAAANAGRSALLVLALGGRPDLLLDATRELIHQSARRSLVPDALALVDELRRAGHAAVLSGAGPSVLVLTTDSAAVLARLGDQGLPPGWSTCRPGLRTLGASVRSDSQVPTVPTDRTDRTDRVEAPERIDGE
jgi:homoserine kinase